MIEINENIPFLWRLRAQDDSDGFCLVSMVVPFNTGDKNLEHTIETDIVSLTADYTIGEEDEILISTDKGSIMRCAVKEIRVAGRNTQGVRIKKLSGSEKVVSVIKIEDNIE